MIISLICIGKNQPSWINDGFYEYAKRLPKEYQLNLIEIAKPKTSKNESPVLSKKKEAEKIRDAIPKQNIVIALDEHGSEWDTKKLALNLQKWHDLAQNITLVIGGPNGLDDSIKQEAHQLWSLSKLTMPHGLVRIVLAEQLYRAWSLICNHPYHRE